jgi:hypothetical protein
MMRRIVSLFRKRRPALSVVVLCYRMERQIGNTLLSLSPPFQRHLDTADYEILLVDNGSPEPLAPAVWGVADNVRYRYVPPAEANPCPATALNQAVAQAQAPIVCVMIDGARMVSPATLHWGLRLARLSPRTVVEVRGWHLGPKVQMESIQEGYNHDVERQLLEQARWQENGYRLFEISATAGSTRFGFYQRAYESNCLFLHRSFYRAIGGFDERYREPGGGLVNLDFFWRATTAASTVFTVLGEGTFHQVHGGAATGLRADALPDTFRRWQAEYERLSRPWTGEPPPYEPVLVGHAPRECRKWLQLEAA